MKGLRLAWGGVILALLNVFGIVRVAETQAAPAFGASGAIADKCWVYTHLNKAGGSTLKKVLKTIWGQRLFIYSGGTWHGGSSKAQSIAEELVRGDKWSVVAGGYTESLRRSGAVGSKCKWFTMFRHPVSRMVSAYYFCKYSPSCARDIVDPNRVDVVTFAKHWGNYSMRQFVLSFMSIDDVLTHTHTDAVQEKLPQSGKPLHNIPPWYLVKMYVDAHTQESISESIPDAAFYAMLQPVQDLLRDQYSAVGILEEFNTTLSLFNAALQMPGVDWHEQYMTVGAVNVDNRHADEKVATLADAWTNSEIKKYLQLDLILYEHAVAIFHQQTRAYGV